MCGVFAILDAPGRPGSALRHASVAERRLDSMRHRGPDGRGVLALANAWLGHRRLAIVDPAGGAQPLSHDGVAWVANCEIYDHEEQRRRAGLVGLPGTDAAVLGPLWHRAAEEDLAAGRPDGLPAMLHLARTEAQQRFLRSLDGPFAMVAVDTRSGRWIAARDAIGICPLYLGRHQDGTVWFASEMKALVEDCHHVEIVPPGSFVVGGPEGLARRRWHEPDWKRPGAHPAEPFDPERLRDAVVRAVEKRFMSDAPLGLLLSGGLDSSLVCSIAARLVGRAGRDEARHSSCLPEGRLHTFSIGLEGSPDLIAARQVADFLGTQHHEYHFSVEEALAVLPKVVEHLESWEQIRTGVPTYLLAQRIAQSGLGIKTLLSGEGADEIFGGYLYFHRAPGDREFFAETVRKVERLHQFDVMRANKAPMAHGLELRFPFLDRDVVDLAMSMDPREKRCDRDERPDGVHPRIEKYPLRKAFDTPQDPWLPEAVLWRAKEQFSDGVGYHWVDRLRECAARQVRDPQLRRRIEGWGHDAPPTDELCWMRELFEWRFVEGRPGGRSALATVPRGRSVACSTPEALAWDPEWQRGTGDISGRAIRGVHSDAFGQGELQEVDLAPSAPEPAAEEEMRVEAEARIEEADARPEVDSREALLSPARGSAA